MREGHQTQAGPGSVKKLPQRKGCLCQIMKLPLGRVAREGGEREWRGKGQEEEGERDGEEEKGKKGERLSGRLNSINRGAERKNMVYFENC